MSDREIREALERIKSNVRELEYLLDRRDEKKSDSPLVVDPDAVFTSWHGRTVHLTKQQTAIVSHLARRPAMARTYEQIAEATGSIDASPGSIHCQIGKIKARFRQVDPDFDQIENVYGAGYRWGT